MTFITNPDLSNIAQSVRTRLAEQPQERQILAFIGAPGTGKSTAAQQLADDLGPKLAALVPMDGFHLAHAQVVNSPLVERKGAIDTFDAYGYVNLVGRLHLRTEPVVYAPTYQRGLEEPISASIAVPSEVPVIITEGNYLLFDDEPWARLRAFFTETYFVDTPRALRIQRLVSRHERFGKTLEQATAWANGPDERNAEIIERTKEHADRIIKWY